MSADLNRKIMIEENKEEAKKLYDMPLHGTMEVKTGAISYFVTRVIGGWIYNHPRLDCNQMNSVFVPWNNEMQ